MNKINTLEGVTNFSEAKTEYNELGLIEGYSCPFCGGPVKEEYQDDVGTTFCKCEKCSQYSAKGKLKKSKERLELDEALARDKEIKRLTTLAEIEEILSSTIKQDSKNKLISFLTMLLTYTSEDQINISFSAESSTGKSYIPLELAWYFPKEDVLKHGYVSPTAFFHDSGVLLPDPDDKTEEVDEKGKPRPKRKIIYLDLKQKILIFLDQPHDQLLQRLRPLLSHDEKIIVHKITDRSRRGSLITKKVWIEGYPTVLFCTAKFNLDDQERTRLMLLSPETSQEKLREGILLKIEKDSDKESFNVLMEKDEKRQWLKHRVAEIKRAEIKNIVIPDEFKQKVIERFFEKHENLIPRHQRDVGRLIAMIKAHCLLNLWNRGKMNDNLMATEQDLEEGFRIYEDVASSNEMGLPPEVYSLYVKLEDKLVVYSEKEEDGSTSFSGGLTRREFQAAYYNEFHRTIGKKRLEEIIDLLSSVGLVTEEVDPSDKRIKKVVAPRRVYSFKAQNGFDSGEKQYTQQGATTSQKLLGGENIE